MQVEVVGFGDIRRRMVEQAPLGAGADLFLGSHESLGDLVAANLLEPIDLGTRAEDYLAAGLEAFSSGGRLYGLPYSLEAVALYRNTALAPDAPATFEDLLAVCDELGDAIDRCLAIPAGDAYYNYAFLASPGGYIFGYDPAAGYDLADIGIDNEGAVAGATFLDGLVATGYLDGSVDYGTMTRLFFEGRAAFMWTGPWAVPDADDAVAAGTLPGYAVSPLPQILGHEAIPMVRAQGFMVNAFSERKDLALEFLLDYLATPEVMAALYEADPRPPASAAALEALAGDPDAQAFAASAAAGRPIPNVPEMGARLGPPRRGGDRRLPADLRPGNGTARRRRKRCETRWTTGDSAGGRAGAASRSRAARACARELRRGLGRCSGGAGGGADLRGGASGASWAMAMISSQSCARAQRPQ